MVTKVTDWLSETCDLCSRVRPVIALFLYVVVLGFSFYGMYLLQAWWKDSRPAVSFGQGEITPAIVRPGDKMLVHLTVNKLRSCDGEVHRVVTGECGHHVLSRVETTLSEGFSGRITLPFQLPHEAIPGRCGFRVYARYSCNPFDWVLQRQVFESDLIPFQVVGYEQ
jgi:hypothetical protein